MPLFPADPDWQTNPDSISGPPGLLDSLTASSSLSLQSHSDLDNFLPFATNNPQTTSHYYCPILNIPNTSPTQLTLDLQHNWSNPDSLIIPQPVPYPMADTTQPPALNQPVNNVQHIPVIIGHGGPHPKLKQPCNTRTTYRKTIRRDNRAVTALSLPNIMVTNHRSVFPKFNNLVDEILENDMHLGLHCEIWENKENKAHANMIEEALEIHGIQYISTPRPDRRGGGAAITLISDSPFVLTKLDISVVDGGHSLEVCWGLLKPRTPTGHIRSIIVCAFYMLLI